MSSTRHAATDSELHQQRFASDPEFSTSISALLAAKRIALIADRELRELLWFIQWRSLQPRGLRRLAEELTTKFSKRLGTPAMRGLRCKPGQNLTRSQVIKIRKEFPGGGNKFRLRGEPIDDDLDALLDRPTLKDYNAPESYRTDDFLNVIADEAERLHECLTRPCVDPESDLNGVWYFDDLIGALRQLRRDSYDSPCGRVYRRETDAATLADTEPTRQIDHALDFCFRQRRMVLIEGESGIGKSETVKAWCDRQQGLARYVEIPSSNDDRSFFAAIAESIGVARGTSYNGQQIKLRVEEALRASGLMLVLDESQFAWPQYMRPQGIPARIQWIMTMFNAGTPIALVALPKFSKWRELYAAKTNWDQRQLQRRLNRPVRLPDEHLNEELAKIARAHLPEGDSRSLRLLTAWGIINRKQGRSGASSIFEAVQSAIYRAGCADRSTPTFADVEAALQHDHGFHNPAAISAALQPPSKTVADAVKPGRNGQAETPISPRQASRFKRLVCSETDFATALK
jgi:hypothetical protein